MKEKVCILGLGYIGLPTACLISENSFDVCGIDVDEQVLKNIRNLNLDFNEPSLNSLLKKSLKSKNLKVQNIPTYADYFLICTPTPIIYINNQAKPDLSFVFEAVDSILFFLKNDDTIIIESTIPVGTTEKLKKYVMEARPDLNRIFIAYCPERVLPGNIVFELKNNTRIIGGVNKISTNKVAKFYQNFVLGEILYTTSKVAEICKLAENAFRDVNIGFANELSLICKDKNINVAEVINFTNKHPRVNILNPGIGVGGHCIPVDPWFLISENYEKSELMRAAREVNTKKTTHIINDIEMQIESFFKKNKQLPVVSFLGVSYKENSNDVRGAPAVQIIEKIKKKLKKFYIVDPFVEKILNIKTHNLEKAIENSDIIFILVKHDNFNDIDIKISNKTIFVDYTFS